jgi:hypothetical protein
MVICQHQQGWEGKVDDSNSKYAQNYHVGIFLLLDPVEVFLGVAMIPNLGLTRSRRNIYGKEAISRKRNDRIRVYSILLQSQTQFTTGLD